MLDFVVTGLWTAVGENHAVHHELPVVRHVAEVAAVGKDHLAVFVLLPKSLVDPIPNRRAENHVRRLDCVLIVLEVAHRVAHVVRVFGNVERLLRLMVARLPLNPVDARILVGVHVDDGVVALVLQGARGVDLADRRRSRREVLARTRLVAERPHRDARMVAVAPHHVDVARDRRLLPFLAMRKRRLAVVVAVRFDVRLVHHVDAVDVAEVVEVVVLRVVRVADVVDVRLLHETNVLKLPLARNVVPVHRIGLVPIHAAKLDLLAVEVVASIADLGSAKTDKAGDVFRSTASRQKNTVFRIFVIVWIHDQLIAIGGLCAPQLRILHNKLACCPQSNALHFDGLVIHVVQSGKARGAGRRNGVTRDNHLPVAIQFVLVNRSCRHRKIPDARRRPCKKPGRAGDARKTEHVLVFEIRCVRIAVDFERDNVFAWSNELRDIELCRIP